MKTKKIDYISLASVISAIAVVYLHTNDCFWNFSTANYWFEANIIESVFYFAVPIFFMISGAMLIDFSKKYSLKEYFSKRINKTVIPYIIWSLIGLILQVYVFEKIGVGSFNLHYIANGLLNGNLVHVYWFFIPLFCIYLSIPLFSFVDDSKKKEIFVYLTTLAFILNVFIPFLISVFGLNITFGLNIAVASGYLFFTLTGYLLHKYPLEDKCKYILYALAICGLLMHIIGTYCLSVDAGKIVYTFKGYYNLPCLLYSLGIFVFAKYDLVKIMKFDPVNKVINFLNSYTFGIYLIHIFVLWGIIKLFNADIYSLSFRLIAPVVIIILSIVIIYVLRKIPYVRYIVP